MPEDRPPLVIVAGATASGKTGVAIQMARLLGGEVINADSRLVYRGLDIGTAKPSEAERAGIPHHLIDILDPRESFSLADFISRSAAAITGVAARGRLPIVVGGTGQYVTALARGWNVPSVPPNPALRQRLGAEGAAHGPEAVFRQLAGLDPAAARRVDRRNLRRVIRALEVTVALGPSHERPTSGRRSYCPLLIALQAQRADLYARADERIDTMIAAGWPDEVRSLLASGIPRDAPGMFSIGYREMAAYVEGELTLEAAVSAIRRATRQLIRRQHNWFRPDDPDIHWLPVGPEAPRRAAALARQWMTNATGGGGTDDDRR